MLTVKCAGCGMMVPEDDVCDAMDEDICYRLVEDDMKELNFHEPDRSKELNFADWQQDEEEVLEELDDADD